MQLAGARRELLVARWHRFCADIKKALKRLFAKLPNPRRKFAKHQRKNRQKNSKK